MSSGSICIMITIAAYLIFMVGIGIFFTKKNNDAGDFYLGGRQLGPFVTAMSAEASDMSSYLLMGIPGVAYLTGVADATWTAIGLAIGTYLNWLIVAKRLRRYTVVANDSITLPEFFKNRFHDKGNALLLISALIIIIFFVPYTASGFAACGKLFSSLFGVDYLTAMIISAIVIVVYTALGGFLAASTTDFIQSIIMTAALAAVLIFGVVTAGGVSNVVTNAQSLSGYLSMNHTYDVAANSANGYGFLTIISTLSWGLGYFGMPHILLRFMAIKDDSKIKLSRRIATVWVVISMGVAILIGIVAKSLSMNGALDTFTDPGSAETAIVKIAGLMSENGVLLAIIAGIILAGILAATMSTADSQLLAASSSVSENIFKDVFKLKISEKATMIIARATVVVVAVIAAFLATDPNSSVFNIVSFAWAGFGAAFAPVVLFALFWKRFNKWGALAGMISGGAMVFIWEYVLTPLGGVFSIYELLPAFLVACIFIVVVSLLTPAPSKEVVDDFEKVKAMGR